MTEQTIPDSTNFSRPRPMDNPETNDRKRRRKVLSCYDCRRRKLQCDRCMPACGRCTKAGQAASCLYIDDAADVARKEADADVISPSASAGTQSVSSRTGTKRSAPSHGDTLSRLEYQESKIKQLEAELAQATSTNCSRFGSRLPPTPESAAGTMDLHAICHEREHVRLRGKSFKTQFSGNTVAFALLAYNPELHNFTRDTFENFPILVKMREDVRAMETTTKSAKHDALYGPADDILRTFLPPKSETDLLVRMYLDNFGALYHVLHLPTFWREYNEIFRDVAKSNTHSVAIVLLMTAAARCLVPSEPMELNPRGCVARDLAIRAIEAVDDWLRTRSQKHVTSARFQILVLSLVAKRIATYKWKRVWTDSGDTLRFCMAAGLHRSPNLLRKATSVLDKELRKRVWAAVSELELQAAFNRGMVSVPWNLQSDCPPPSHVDDDDIDENTTQLPPIKSAKHFSNTSFLTVASDSIMLRHALNTELNDIRRVITFEDIRKYTDELQAHLSELPEWIGSTTDVPRALLSLTLHHYLLVLHERHLRTASTKSEIDYSKLIVLDSASKIITTHTTLANRNCFALELLCYDQARASLSLCHLAASTLDPHADDILSAAIRDAVPRRVADAIALVEDKVVRFGREQRPFWVLLAANAYMKARAEPRRRREFMQEAVDRVIGPGNMLLASSGNAPVAASVGGVPSSEPLKGVLEYYNPDPRSMEQTGAVQPDAAGQESDPTLFNVDDMMAWTFADWSYDVLPEELAQVLNGQPIEYNTTT